MKLNQDGILTEDKNLAINVRNYLIAGNRVIGDPGEGLRHTLSALEKKRDERQVGVMDWGMKDFDLEQEISLTKAGIKGEEELCDYLARLIKFDDKLNGLVAFASLAYDLGQDYKNYIPDTDTLLVFGNNVLIVDAKNLKTKPGMVLAEVDGVVMDIDKGKELIEVHPSTHIWRKIFTNAGIPFGTIDGYVCIVNDTPVEIIRDDAWERSETKLIHISELREILNKWVEGKDNTLSLKMLTEIAKAQIKKEKDISFDVDAIKRRFGV